MPRVLSWAAAGLVPLLAAGCGGGGPKPVGATVPVGGKVTVDGQPVTAGQVSFTPFDANISTGDGACSGQIDPSGGYKVFTAGKDGAPPGRYKVTVTPSMVPTGGNKMPTAPFHARFSDPKQTTLVVEVKADAAPGAYDLKLTAK